MYIIAKDPKSAEKLDALRIRWATIEEIRRNPFILELCEGISPKKLMVFKKDSKELKLFAILKLKSFPRKRIIVQRLREVAEKIPLE